MFIALQLFILPFALMQIAVRKWCQKDPRMIVNGKPVQIDTMVFTDEANLPSLVVANTIVNIEHNVATTVVRDPADTQKDLGNRDFIINRIRNDAIPVGAVKVMSLISVNPEPGTYTLPPVATIVEPLAPSTSGPVMSSGMLGAWTNPVTVIP